MHPHTVPSRRKAGSGHAAEIPEQNLAGRKQSEGKTEMACVEVNVWLCECKRDVSEGKTDMARVEVKLRVCECKEM